MSSHHILVAYNATDEAADGLALAHLLEQRLGNQLLVARVISGNGRASLRDPARQRTIREVVADTRRTIIAALPEVGGAEIAAIASGDGVAKSLHEAAIAEDAEAIVVGSSHARGLGRLILGGSPELIADGAPCPVFVAPPGFREVPELAPELIGVAYDGSPSADAALHYAASLADRLGVALRVIAVRPPLRDRPIGHAPDAAASLTAAVDAVSRQTGGSVPLDTLELHGAPVSELAGQTEDALGLLVIGSRAKGPLRRVLLGSVSDGVLRAASAPVVVVPS